MVMTNAAHGKLLLTAELLQRDGLGGIGTHRLDTATCALLAVRFPPIDDLVGTLDHIASREIAA